MAFDLFSAAVTAGLGAELLACKAASSATGAVAVVAITEAALILTSVASPIFFSGRSGDLQGLGGSISGKVTEINTQVAAFADEWEGPAVEQLMYYWNRQVAPLLEALQPVCDGAAQVMDAMASAEWTLIGGMFASTTGLLVALISGLAANAVPVVGQAACVTIQWGAVAAFAAIVAALVGGIVAYFVQLAGAANAVQSAAAQIGEALYTDAESRTGNKLVVPPAVLPALQDSIAEAQAQYQKKD